MKYYFDRLNGLLKVVGRMLFCIVIATLFSVAAAAPSEAAIVGYGYKSAAPSDAVSFDPDRVRLGITPTGWSNSDDLTIDTVPPIPYQQMLSEMALTGFKGTQNAPKFPGRERLKEELSIRGLTISEPWVGTYFTLGDEEDSKRIFDEQLDFMRYMGGSNVMVVAELGGAVHQQPVYPLDNRPIFTDEQWNALFKGLNELGKKAHNAGFVLCYHPHIGTGVETLEDIDRLMEGTNPKYLKLLLDTGHLYYAGVDPVAVAQKYGDRINHVHLKNIRQSILEESKTKKWSFLTSIRGGSDKNTPGIFTVPGDDDGVIKFGPIFEALYKANYEGWLVVEAEQDPNKADPLRYALIARDYLKSATGL